MTRTFLIFPQLSKWLLTSSSFISLIQYTLFIFNFWNNVYDEICREKGGFFLPKGRFPTKIERLKSVYKQKRKVQVLCIILESLFLRKLFILIIPLISHGRTYLWIMIRHINTYVKAFNQFSIPVKQKFYQICVNQLTNKTLF